MGCIEGQPCPRLANKYLALHEVARNALTALEPGCWSSSSTFAARALLPQMSSPADNLAGIPFRVMSSMSPPENKHASARCWKRASRRQGGTARCTPVPYPQTNSRTPGTDKSGKFPVPKRRPVHVSILPHASRTFHAVF